MCISFCICHIHIIYLYYDKLTHKAILSAQLNHWSLVGDWSKIKNAYFVNGTYLLFKHHAKKKIKRNDHFGPTENERKLHHLLVPIVSAYYFHIDMSLNTIFSSHSQCYCWWFCAFVNNNNIRYTCICVYTYYSYVHMQFIRILLFK